MITAASSSWSGRNVPGRFCVAGIGNRCSGRLCRRKSPTIISGGGRARPVEAAGGALLLYPAFGGDLIARLSVDPACARRRLLELPERRLGLEPIDEEMTALKRRRAMRRRGGDEH